MSDEIDAFVAALRRAAPGLVSSVDRSDDPNGETFIDIHDGDFVTQVSFRQNAGFGLYIGSDSFGQRPDELFSGVPKAVDRILQLRDGFREQGAIKPMTLKQMRVLAGFTQVEVAEALSIQQPTVQRIETRENVRLDTLARHVQAMGGRLEVSVKFEDMEARLDLPALRDAG